MYLRWLGRGRKLYRYLRGAYARLKTLQEQSYWNWGILGKFRADEGQEGQEHSFTEGTYIHIHLMFLNIFKCLLFRT